MPEHYAKGKDAKKPAMKNGKDAKNGKDSKGKDAKGKDAKKPAFMMKKEIISQQ